MNWKGFNKELPLHGQKVLVLCKLPGGRLPFEFIWFGQFLKEAKEEESIWKIHNGTQLTPVRYVPQFAISESGLIGWMPYIEPEED